MTSTANPTNNKPDRPRTPDRKNPDGSTTIVMKCACNGCGLQLGDITDEEMAAAMNSRPLPDVRRECPACGPTAPPPVCHPMTLFSGEFLCIEGECSHDTVPGSDECTEISRVTVCADHSEFTPGFEDAYEVATHAEPWPCKRTAACPAV